MLDGQLLMRKMREHQVDYVAFPFDHGDPRHPAVLMQGMNDQSESEAGDEDVTPVETGVIFHRPPMRRIIDHPCLVLDRQAADREIPCSVELMSLEPVGVMDSPVAERFDFRFPQLGFGVRRGWRFPSGQREHFAIVVPSPEVYNPMRGNVRRLLQSAGLPENTFPPTIACTQARSAIPADTRLDRSPDDDPVIVEVWL